MALKIRHRSRLRRKEAADFLSRLASDFGIEVPAEDAPIDEADAGGRRLLLRGADPFALIDGADVAPTVRALLATPATKRAVTVDMGAVPHIYNGADVMAPGIVGADDGIRPGDLVWVRDERNRRPLAVGRALLDGPSMVRGRTGKAIETIHHVGDEIWALADEAA